MRALLENRGFFAILFLCSFFLVFVLSYPLGKAKKERQGAFLFPDSGLVRALSFECEPFLADNLWIRVVQFIGEINLDNVHKKIKNVLATSVLSIPDVDSSFVFPLEAASSVLSVGLNEPFLSSKLLEKGMLLAPNSWKFPFYLAFNAYFYGNEYKKAAFLLSLAAKKEGCPGYVAQLAGKFYAYAGDPYQGLRFLEQMEGLESLKDFKGSIEKRKKEIALTIHIKEIETIIEKFKKKSGWYPHTMEELKLAGFMEKIPAEPFGGHYAINPKTRKVYSTSGVKPLSRDSSYF